MARKVGILGLRPEPIVHGILGPIHDIEGAFGKGINWLVPSQAYLDCVGHEAVPAAIGPVADAAAAGLSGAKIVRKPRSGFGSSGPGYTTPQSVLARQFIPGQRAPDWLKSLRGAVDPNNRPSASVAGNVGRIGSFVVPRAAGVSLLLDAGDRFVDAAQSCEVRFPPR